MIVDNDKELQELIEKWQDILRLRDWNIKGKLVERHEIEGIGMHDSFQHLKESTVKIARIDGSFKDIPHGGDQEETVIHELIHIHLLNDDFTAQEQAVNMISDALLRLHRNGKCP